jgi:hypothetical protein
MYFNRFAPILLVIGVTAVPSTKVPPIMNMAAAPGKKVEWVGHSFHVFLPTPVAQLAKEAGISGHQNLIVDFIPASVPCQHWNKGGEVQNILKAGTADVLTLSTREDVPDACIPKFVRLAVSQAILMLEKWIYSYSPMDRRRNDLICMSWFKNLGFHSLLLLKKV